MFLLYAAGLMRQVTAVTFDHEPVASIFRRFHAAISIEPLPPIFAMLFAQIAPSYFSIFAIATFFASLRHIRHRHMPSFFTLISYLPMPVIRARVAAYKSSARR